MTEALDDLNKVLEISANDKVASQDRECLNALMNCSLKGQEEGDEHSKAVFMQAVSAINKLIGQEKNDKIAKLVHESSILHQHSQVIPSANRTKMDKIRAIRRRKEQDRENKECGGNGPRKNDLRFRVQQ